VACGIELGHDKVLLRMDGTVHPYRRGVAAAIDSMQFVMPGTSPAMTKKKKRRSRK
jgi:hypothetical protein